MHVVAVRDDASVVVRVADHRSVGQPMLVLVRVSAIVMVFMPVLMAVMVDMVVPAAGPMNVAVRVIVSVIMVVPVHGAVCMPMLVSVLVAFDLRFAAAATACRAHIVLLGPPQAISMSFTRISSPCVTCNW
jgi:hypothetical protein